MSGGAEQYEAGVEVTDPQAIVKQYQFGALRDHFHRELRKGLDQLHEKHDAFADHIAKEVQNLELQADQNARQLRDDIGALTRLIQARNGGDEVSVQGGEAAAQAPIEPHHRVVVEAVRPCEDPGLLGS